MSLDLIFKFFLSCINGVRSVISYFEPKPHVEIYELEQLVPEPEVNMNLRSRAETKIDVDDYFESMQFMDKAKASPIKEESDDDFVMVEAQKNFKP